MKKDPKQHKEHWKRIRKKITSTPLEYLTETELLEGLLQFTTRRGDTNEISKNLLSKFTRINIMLNSSQEELMTVEGIGDTISSKLVMLRIFIDYYNLNEANKPENMPIQSTGSESYFKILRTYYATKHVEEIYLICLDKYGRRTGAFGLGEGKSDYAILQDNFLLKLTKHHKAEKVIISHNHTSTLCLPSDKDYEFTKELYKQLSVLDIELLDHVIIGQTGTVFSFAKSGILEKIANSFRNAIQMFNEN